ncbi:MAG: hypothetical protein ROO71_09040 [Balneola sp.]
MNEGQIYILSDAIAVCTLPDGSTIDIKIERPNDLNRPYRIIRRVLKLSSDYRDPNYVERNGSRKFELEFQLSYDFHRMDLTPLLVSKSVLLKVPTYLYNDSRYYQEFEVRFINDELNQEPLNGLNVQHFHYAEKQANPVPNSGEILRFRSSPYTAAEFIGILTWFFPKTAMDNDSEPIPGFIISGETEDDLGLQISNLEPAEFGQENTTTVKVGYKYFNLESIILESNNG